jgi:hypothetical protein
MVSTQPLLVRLDLEADPPALPFRNVPDGPKGSDEVRAKSECEYYFAVGYI